MVNGRPIGYSLYRLRDRAFVMVRPSSSSSQYCAGRRLTLHIRTLEVRPEARDSLRS